MHRFHRYRQESLEQQQQRRPAQIRDRHSRSQQDTNDFFGIFISITIDEPVFHQIHIWEQIAVDFLPNYTRPESQFFIHL